MAQTGFTPIALYYSSTASATPTAGNLVAGELALNNNDGRLFYKDSSNVVQVIGTKGGVGTSSTTQVLYNSSGLVVGSANLTFNGTTLTTANDASISGLTVGKGGGAVSGNTAFGYAAVGANSAGVTGANNTGVGLNSLWNLTSGTDNTMVGKYSGIGLTSGASNVGVGSGTLYSNTTASNNTAVGYQAGYSNTTGASNFFGGWSAGKANVTGAECTYLGNQAGFAQTGGFNTYVGSQSAILSTSGTYNAYFGWASGYLITTGSKNTIIGSYSGNQGGLDIRTASNYIVLSDGDGNPRGIFDSTGAFQVGCTSQPTGAANGIQLKTGSGNSIYSITGTSAANQILFQNSNGSVGAIQTSASTCLFLSLSDYRLKENILPMQGALDKVSTLKPVTYKWKVDGSEGQGFIAHELAEICPDAVAGKKDAVDTEGKPVYQSIDTSFLVATLVSAIQELKAEVDSLKQQINGA